MTADPFAWPVDPRIAELHRKLARVEALADEWDDADELGIQTCYAVCADSLRAALDGDQ